MTITCQKSIGMLPLPKPEDCTRVLCFSDIHLGLFPKWRELWFSKRFLGAFNHYFRRRHQLRVENIHKLAEILPRIEADAVICAGDLTSIGEPEEFEWAVKEVEAIRSRNPARFFYIPGNHDAYVRCPHGGRALQEVMSKLNPPEAMFTRRSCRLELPGLSLVLLDAARPVGPWFSCGVIDDAMQERLLSLLEPSGSPIAVACHFPAFSARGGKTGWRHGLRGESILRRQMESGGIQALLSGHVHRQYAFQLPNGALQSCSGSLTLHGHFSVVDFFPSRAPEIHLLHFS